MKRLLIGSLLLPMLSISSTVHARGTIFDFLGFGKKEQQQESQQKKKNQRRVIPRNNFDDYEDDYSPFDTSDEPMDLFGNDDFGYDNDGFGSPFYGEEAPVPMPYPSWRTKTKSRLSNEALYQALGMNAIWTANGRMTMQAIQLREALLNADFDGLVVSDYWTQEHENLFHTLTPETEAQFESMMTTAFIKFATHVSVGRVNPKAAGEEVKISARTMKAETLAALLTNTSVDLKTSLETIKPQWKSYNDLRIVLSTLRRADENEIFPEVETPEQNLQIGDHSAGVAAVKRRLGTLGYAVADTSDVVTEDFQKVVRKYITDHNIANVKGVSDLDASSRFWQRISVPLSNRLTQIMLTMEKLRWVKSAPEKNHIEVNLAFERLRVFEGSNVVMAMKTINGRIDRKTPMLQDKVINILLNPTWTVPASLIIKDKLPALQANPNYVEEHHFSVWDSKFESQYDPNRIDWSRVSAKDVDKFYLVQAPGLGNALGVMKFNLTNDYAIYLHDTNERYLFSESDRLLSSGCVRLERPFDLAVYLLQNNTQWNTREALEAAVSKTEWAEDSVPRVKNKHQINLENAMPVYLMYLTAEVDPETGVLKLGADHYGQDARLFNALKSAAGR